MGLAGADPLRLDAIFRTVRVRDGLECYTEMACEQALEQFRHEESIFVAGGMKKAPKVPPILLAQKTKQSKRRRRKKGEFVEPAKPAFITALENAE